LDEQSHETIDKGKPSVSKARFRTLIALELLLIISYWVWATVTSPDSLPSGEVKQNIQEANARLPMTTLVLLTGDILQITGLVGIGLLKAWARHAF
jgi:hypothetical protein